MILHGEHSGNLQGLTTIVSRCYFKRAILHMGLMHQAFFRNRNSTEWISGGLQEATVNIIRVAIHSCSHREAAIAIVLLVGHGP